MNASPQASAHHNAGTQANARVDLLDVLRTWGHERRSGTLLLRDVGPLAALEIAEGRLVQVRRARAGETLGALLVRAGVLESGEAHGAAAGPAGEALEQLIARVERTRGVEHLLVRVDDVIAEAMVELALLVIAHGRGSASARVPTPPTVDDRVPPPATGLGPRTMSAAGPRPWTGLGPRTTSGARGPEPASAFAATETSGPPYAPASAMLPGAMPSGATAAGAAPLQPAPRRFHRTVGDDALTLPSGIDLEDVIAEARARGFTFLLDRFDDHADRQPPTLIIVDDDPAFLAAAAGALGRAGVSTALVTSARQGAEQLADLGDDDVILVDLFMPRANGRGFLGGLELARAAAARGVGDRLYVALESAHEDAERELRAMGAAGCLRRPAADDPAALAAFLAPLVSRLHANDVGVQVPVDLVDELRGELRGVLDDSEWTPPRGVPEGAVDELTSLSRLKTLLAELNSPDFDEEIPLLVLRFISAFFPRATLFRVDDQRDEFVGLGGFGVEAPDPGRLIRSVRIPRSAPSVLADAVLERSGLRHAFSDSAADRVLAEGLGIERSAQLYVAPLFSPRGIEAVILADDAGAQRPFPNLALLEIFLQQAAAAMDRAVLARQVRWLESTAAPPAGGATPHAATPHAATPPAAAAASDVAVDVDDHSGSAAGARLERVGTDLSR